MERASDFAAQRATHLHGTTKARSSVTSRSASRRRASASWSNAESPNRVRSASAHSSNISRTHRGHRFLSHCDPAGDDYNLLIGAESYHSSRRFNGNRHAMQIDQTLRTRIESAIRDAFRQPHEL